MQIVVAQYDLYAVFVAAAELQARQRLRPAVHDIAHQP